MPNNRTEESVGSTARKAFVTAIISVALLPISGWAGYAVGRLLAAPRLRVEYVNVQLERRSHQPNASATERIRQNAELNSRLRSIVASQDPDYRCRRWLDGQPWHDTCLVLFEDAAFYLRNLATATIEQQGAMAKTPSIPPVQGQQIQKYVAQLEETRRDLDELLTELARLRGMPPGARTGHTLVIVGILNTGDSEGVVFRNGRLRFLDSEVPIIGDRYTVVKAHSLEEIRFLVDKPNAARNPIEKWESLVIKEQQQRFEVVLSDGKRSLVAAGHLPQ
jgi:hypothetical protein